MKTQGWGGESTAWARKARVKCRGKGAWGEERGGVKREHKGWIMP